MKKICYLNLLIFFSFSIYGQDILYDEKDLEILVQQKNYIEFFNHAKDLRPSKRDKIWEENVQQMGIGFLDFLASKTLINPAEIKLVKNLSYWNTFKDNEFFIRKRDFYFLKDLKNCLELKMENCEEKAITIYNDFNHDITFSNDIINLISNYPKVFTDPWAYVKKLTKDEISEFYCNKGKLNDIIIQKIFSSQRINEVLDDLHADCIKVLVPQLNDKIVSSSFSERKRAYTILKKYKYLKPNDQVIYDTLLYLNQDKLSNAEIDEIVSSFKLINKNYKLRENVLENLKKLDPIPDHIFQSDQKTNLKIKVLNRYFPEFIDYYSNTCLTYLNGDKNFIKGNPTPACHHFFEKAKNTNILPQPILKKYSQATSFIK